ncbi:Clp1/GlmU family protein [Methanocaldococcus indicus]|uniref:Clp1/GlmU family protein n=1 Tax=Methanocaldococcus indicus TaxID=213231 RepID=UPI003C6D8A98
MLNKASTSIEISKDRYELLEEIKENNYKRILIVGNVDVGKTTLINFLSNNLNCGILDLDVGQKSILPPATISLKYSFLVKHYFIGSTTPAQFIGEMIVGANKLANLVNDLVLIDTPGFIYGIGGELIKLLIESLKPDLIVGIERDKELRNLLRYENVKFLKSYSNKTYSKEERKKIREEKWKKYFENSKEIIINFKDFILSGSKLFYGVKITENEKYLIENLLKWKILYGSRIDKQYIIVKEDLERIHISLDRNFIFYLDKDRFLNLLVGLIDKDGFCEGLGIVKEIDFENETLKILTPISLDNIKEIRFGRIKINDDFTEGAYLDRELI